MRTLFDVRGGSNEEKLRDAGLTTLAERRKRGDAIEVFKTLNGINRFSGRKINQIKNEHQRGGR